VRHTQVSITNTGSADHPEKALNALAEDGVFNGKDQVMLFTRPPPHPSSLPPYLLELQNEVRTLIEPLLPQDDFKMALEQPLARQIILNLYPPGEGISPHIDLPNRYADGIIGVSLAGGTTMTFRNGEMRHDAYMPERTIYVMTGEARWEWSHGIEGRLVDEVETGNGRDVETRLRSTRVSVTMRWMKEGAEVLV
jgi:alkylated DNA repair dioxygenase AlkB